MDDKSSMQEFKPFKEGKVREVYDNGDSLIIVATDRISAFDNILKNRITDKGAILTQMSKFWFDFTKNICKNHGSCACNINGSCYGWNTNILHGSLI